MHIELTACYFLGGGVFANFHEVFRRVSLALDPDTSLIGTASEISFRSSTVSLILTEPRLLSRFLILVVPTNNKKLISQLDHNNMGFMTKQQQQQHGIEHPKILM